MRLCQPTHVWAQKYIFFSNDTKASHFYIVPKLRMKSEFWKSRVQKFTASPGGTVDIYLRTN